MNLDMLKVPKSKFNDSIWALIMIVFTTWFPNWGKASLQFFNVSPKYIKIFGTILGVVLYSLVLYVLTLLWVRLNDRLKHKELWSKTTVKIDLDEEQTDFEYDEAKKVFSKEVNLKGTEYLESNINLKLHTVLNTGGKHVLFLMKILMIRLVITSNPKEVTFFDNNDIKRKVHDKGSHIIDFCRRVSYQTEPINSSDKVTLIFNTKADKDVWLVLSMKSMIPVVNSFLPKDPFFKGNEFIRLKFLVKV